MNARSVMLTFVLVYVSTARGQAFDENVLLSTTGTESHAGSFSQKSLGSTHMQGHQFENGKDIAQGVGIRPAGRGKGEADDLSFGHVPQTGASGNVNLDRGMALTNPETDDYMSGIAEYRCARTDGCPRKDSKDTRLLSTTHRQASTGSFDATNPYSVQVFRSPW